MKQIVVNVSEENLPTVMMILSNLKAGLIESIDGQPIKPAAKKGYRPKEGDVVYEGQSPKGKYVSPAAYKSRLQKK